MIEITRMMSRYNEDDVAPEVEPCFELCPSLYSYQRLMLETSA